MQTSKFKIELDIAIKALISSVTVFILMCIALLPAIYLHLNDDPRNFALNLMGTAALGFLLYERLAFKGGKTLTALQSMIGIHMLHSAFYQVTGSDSIETMATWALYLLAIFVFCYFKEQDHKQIQNWAH